MLRPRSALLLALTLTSCAHPTPPQVAPTPRLQPAGCDAMTGPLETLRRLMWSADVSKKERRPPAYPELMARKLDADVAALRAAKPVDAEMDQLNAAVAARLSAFAESTRALAQAHAEQREIDAGAAFDRMLALAQSADALLAAGKRRCGPPPEVLSQLEPSVIQAAVRSHFGGFRSCYEAGLSRNSGLQGRLLMRFVIEPDGHVDSITFPVEAEDPLEWPASARLRSTQISSPGSEMSRCVAQELKTIVFPAQPGKPTTVFYPITFQSDR